MIIYRNVDKFEFGAFLRKTLSSLESFLD